MCTQYECSRTLPRILFRCHIIVCDCMLILVVCIFCPCLYVSVILPDLANKRVHKLIGSTVSVRCSAGTNLGECPGRKSEECSGESSWDTSREFSGRGYAGNVRKNFPGNPGRNVRGKYVVPHARLQVSTCSGYDLCHPR